MDSILFEKYLLINLKFQDWIFNSYNIFLQIYVFLSYGNNLFLEEVLIRGTKIIISVSV